MMAAMRVKYQELPKFGDQTYRLSRPSYRREETVARYHEVYAWDMARVDRHGCRARGDTAEVSRFDAILELFEKYNGKAQPQRRGNRKPSDNLSHQDEDGPGPGTDTQLMTHTDSTDNAIEMLVVVRQKKRSGKEYPRRKDNSDIGGSKGSPKSQGSHSESSGEDDFDQPRAPTRMADEARRNRDAHHNRRPRRHQTFAESPEYMYYEQSPRRRPPQPLQRGYNTPHHSPTSFALPYRPQQQPMPTRVPTVHIPLHPQADNYYFPMGYMPYSGAVPPPPPPYYQNGQQWQGGPYYSYRSGWAPGGGYGPRY